MQQLTDAAKMTQGYSRKRGLSLLLRTMHLVSFGILLGGTRSRSTQTVCYLRCT